MKLLLIFIEHDLSEKILINNEVQTSENNAVFLLVFIHRYKFLLQHYFYHREEFYTVFVQFGLAF